MKKAIRLVSSGGLLLALCAVGAAGAQAQFNEPGNILIADPSNNRIIEIDPSGG